MTQEHPITPTEEVINEWESEWHHHQGKDTYEVFMAKQAAQWGADQELKACCEILRGEFNYYHLTEPLRAARRPKPPSLKEQALEKLAWIDKKLEAPLVNHCDAIHIIRRALEQLDD